MSRTFLILLAIVALAPMYFMLTGSLQDIHGVFAMPPRIVPRSMTLSNYQWIASLHPGRWVLNTVIVTALTTVLSVSVCVMAAYAFAFFRFPLKRILWLALLSGLLIPRISSIIPLFVVMRRLGISGTLIAAVLPITVSPMAIYLARIYFESIPKALLESARMDGAHEWQILWLVVAPVSRPIVTALALFAAVGSMGDYLWQLLQLQRTNVQTLLVGLMRATMMGGGDDVQVNPIGRSLAVGIALLAPVLVVFFSASRYFTSAIGGAIKE